MAFDTNTGTIVLFGGMGASSPLHDTWTWDGSSWTQQHPAHNPPATVIGPMAYDPASHDILLVTVSMPNGSGSISSADPAAVNPPPAQTWLWDGADWHKSSSTLPPAASFSRMATDAANGDVILVTAAGVLHPPLGAPCRLPVPTSDPIATICPGYTQVQSTWVWNGTSWKDTGAAGPVLSGVTNLDTAAASLVTDPSTGHAEYVASTASIVPLCVTPGLPPPSPSHFLPPPPANGAAGSTGLLTPPAVVSGKPVPAPGEPPPSTIPCAGVKSDGSALPASFPKLVISRWTGSAWSTPQDVAPPKGKAYAGGPVVADIAAHGLVLYNLADGSVSTYTGSWTTKTAAIHPPAQAGAVAIAYDSVRGQLVVFGGEVFSSPPGISLSSETWTWDGSTWVQHGGTLQPQTPISVTGKPGIALPGATSVAPAVPATPH
jgi:hypothetical protein